MFCLIINTGYYFSDYRTWCVEIDRFYADATQLTLLLGARWGLASAFRAVTACANRIYVSEISNDTW